MVTANRPCIPTSVAGCSAGLHAIDSKTTYLSTHQHTHTVQQVQDTLLPVVENDNYFGKISAVLNTKSNTSHVYKENANLKALKSGGTEIYTHV